MSAGATTRARGRRIAHLVARFFETLRAGPPDAAAVAWVAAVLTPAELQLWNEMGRADRAESLAVARRLETTLAGTEYASDPRWYAAALLHDTGKSVSGYGTVGRVVATVVAGGLGETRVRAWARPEADGSGGRVRMGRYVAHDEIGAALLRARGARPEVAGWADAHHRPERWGRSGIPPAVCRALAGADGELVPASRRPGPDRGRREARLNRNGPAADTRRVAYRPESPYFVRLDEAPPVSRHTPLERERHWSDPPAGSGPAIRRRRRRLRIRPVGLVLVALVGWVGWAYTTPGGPEARISSWIDHTRGVVDNVSIGPGLHQTATYLDQLYTSQGSYPDMSQTAIQEDPKAGFGLGMNFIWCSGQSVVLQTPSAGGTVSRLLDGGRDFGDVNVAAGCPANLLQPVPWKAPKP